MKKLLFIIVLLISLIGCGQENEVAKLLNQGYDIQASTFDENNWKALLAKDNDYIVLTANMSDSLYTKANEVFFEEDKYLDFIKSLDIVDSYSVNDKLPTSDELKRYVGMSFGEIEDEGFENTGYIESDNYQYNFMFENDTICLTLKSSADTPIENMDDFSLNDIRQLIVAEVVDCYLSSNILYND